MEIDLDLSHDCLYVQKGCSGPGVTQRSEEEPCLVMVTCDEISKLFQSPWTAKGREFVDRFEILVQQKTTDLDTMFPIGNRQQVRLVPRSSSPKIGGDDIFDGNLWVEVDPVKEERKGLWAIKPNHLMEQANVVEVLMQMTVVKDLPDKRGVIPLPYYVIYPNHFGIREFAVTKGCGRDERSTGEEGNEDTEVAHVSKGCSTWMASF
jgi:hypothetical protein